MVLLWLVSELKSGSCIDTNSHIEAQGCFRRLQCYQNSSYWNSHSFHPRSRTSSLPRLLSRTLSGSIVQLGLYVVVCGQCYVRRP